MTERGKAFLKEAAQDEALMNQLKTARDVESVVQMARERGISLDASDLLFRQSPESVDEDELQAVSGGAQCQCAINGAGLPGRKDDNCICYSFGLGFDQSFYIMRCICLDYGSGKSFG